MCVEIDLSFDFIQDLIDLESKLYYAQNEHSVVMPKAEILAFLQAYESADYETHQKAFDTFKGIILGGYKALQPLVEQRKACIQESLDQNEKIAQIVAALNLASNLLDQTSINSFSLSYYCKDLDALATDLKKAYCVLPESIDDDLEPSYLEIGKAMYNFLSALELSIESKNQA